jgi:drug/metabolite transporter (DMT)-like permease
MRDRWQTILGAMLIVLGVVVLATAPKAFSPIHVVPFILCWTFGGLLLFGVIGTHPGAALQRRLARENGRAPQPVQLDIVERTFRYGARPLRRAMTTTLCVLMGLGFVAFGILVGCIIRGDLATRLFVGIGLTLFGLFLCYYGWRYLYVRIKISPVGIEARLYFRTVRIRWDEVLELTQRQIGVPIVTAGASLRFVGAMNAGKVFWVYSLRDKLWFGDGLVGAAELVQLISRATGLEWE